MDRRETPPGIVIEDKEDSIVKNEEVEPPREVNCVERRLGRSGIWEWERGERAKFGMVTLGIIDMKVNFITISIITKKGPTSVITLVSL